MALKFTPKFSKKDIADFVTKKIAVIEEVAFDQLVDVCEKFVADARSTDTYTDRTRNLRSSIGYVILKDGKEVFGNFDGVEDGINQGRAMVKGLLGDYPKGYIIIVVAGMEYAAAVESKGYDVITGSSLQAEGHLKSRIARLRQALQKLK